MLQERFPEMRPVRSAPPLFGIFGCGTAAYGARDGDWEIGSHVTTLCLTVLFLPVLMLRAYRVVPVAQGLLFLGSVPLSGLAKGYNVLVLVAALAAGGGVLWYQHTHSPDYLAGEQ